MSEHIKADADYETALLAVWNEMGRHTQGDPHMAVNLLLELTAVVVTAATPTANLADVVPQVHAILDAKVEHAMLADSAARMLN
jgi:GTPase